MRLPWVIALGQAAAAGAAALPIQLASDDLKEKDHMIDTLETMHDHAEQSLNYKKSELEHLLGAVGEHHDLFAKHVAKTNQLTAAKLDDVAAATDRALKEAAKLQLEHKALEQRTTSEIAQIKDRTAAEEEEERALRAKETAEQDAADEAREAQQAAQQAIAEQELEALARQAEANHRLKLLKMHQEKKARTIDTMTLAEELAMLHGELNAGTEDVVAEQSNLEAKTAAVIKHLKEQNDQVREDLANMDTDLEDLQQDLEKAKNAMEADPLDMSALRTALKDLQEDLFRAQRDLNRKMKNHNADRNDLVNARKKLQKATDQQTICAHNLKESNEKYTKLVADNAAHLKDLQAHMNQALEELTTSDQVLLSQKAQELETAKTANLKALAKKDLEMKYLEIQKNQVIAEKDKNMSELRARDKQYIAAKEAELQKVKDESTHALLEKEADLTHIKTVDAKVLKKMNHKLDQLRNANLHSHDSLKAKERELEGIRTANEQTLVDLKEEFNENESEKEAEIEDIRSENAQNLAEAQQKLEDLRETDREAMEQLKSLKDQALKLKAAELLALHKELKTKNAKLEHIETNLARMDKDMQFEVKTVPGEAMLPEEFAKLPKDVAAAKEAASLEQAERDARAAQRAQSASAEAAKKKEEEKKGAAAGALLTDGLLEGGGLLTTLGMVLVFGVFYKAGQFCASSGKQATTYFGGPVDIETAFK